MHKVVGTVYSFKYVAFIINLVKYGDGLIPLIETLVNRGDLKNLVFILPIPARINTYTHACTHARLRIQTHLPIKASTHGSAFKRMHALKQACTRALTHTYLLHIKGALTRLQARTRSCKHKLTQTRIHFIFA